MARIDQSLFYSGTVKKYGKTAEGVAWRDAFRQKRRFDALLEAVGDLSGCTVVDAGCGFGDLWLHMKRRERLPGRYIGIDLLDMMVKEARKRTGQRIFRRDLLKDPLPRADWYLASGSLNLLTPFETILAVKRCFDASAVGCAFNLLKGEERHGIYNYWTPRRILRTLRPLGRAEVVEGYLEEDFTVVIRRG